MYITYQDPGGVYAALTLRRVSNFSTSLFNLAKFEILRPWEDNNCLRSSEQNIVCDVVQPNQLWITMTNATKEGCQITLTASQ